MKLTPNPLTFTWAVIACVAIAFLIILFSYRNKGKKHASHFSFAEFLIRILYDFASFMQSCATGADAFLSAYRDTRSEKRIIGMAERHRRLQFEAQTESEAL